ncbi:MAG TPA: GIY-YIG nuclease family protein [Victivallales bacterium]|nr:GIY-YIG nuclease family protein [Victivallales bacterium]
MYYTYIIQSLEDQNQRYIGFTEDLRKRLDDHNSGKCKHTQKYRPWLLVFYAAFKDKQRAYDFEKYLKSGSGHSFSKRHIL